MELTTLFLLCAAAFAVAALVVAAGFGLGTALTPLFLLVYDVKTAVFLVAVVHLANNLFRLALFRRGIDFTIVGRFGLASIAGAIAGSLLQPRIANPSLEIGLGGLLVVLGGLEFLPEQKAWRIPRRYDQAGGFFSGLLGGLIGNQGALRSAYLLNYALSKEAFIATGTAIACLIDVSRIPVYVAHYGANLAGAWGYLLLVIACAFAGTLTGARLVQRLAEARFHRVVAGAIVATGVLLIVSNL